MIETPSMLVGIGKSVRRLIDHPWVRGIAVSIIGGAILYLLIEKPDTLVEIYRSVRDSITAPGVVTSVCAIVIGIVLFILYRLKRSGAIIFSVVIIAVIVSFFLVPAIREFFDAIAALVALIGGLLTLFTIFHPLQSKKRIEKEVIEKIDDTGTTEKGTDKKEAKKIHAIASPSSELCFGRDTELITLEKDLKNKNVVLIKGVPGIGKTTLGLKFRDILEEKGYHTVWYQCDSASYEGVLTFLSDDLKKRGSVTFQGLKDQGIPPRERLKNAVQELCTYPTVLFLDNFQELNDSDFKIFKDHLKGSTLVVMSRTQPAFLLESYESLSSLNRDSSLDLLRTLEVKESQKVLEKIYGKTKGHPWSLVRFADLARVLPVRNLLDGLPSFGEDQESYLNEQCWRYLNEDEKDFLMRASVFVKPLTFEALEVCSKKGILSEVVLSLAQRFYLVRRDDYYYIHDILKDFALLKLKENSKLYSEAERAAADYYGRRLSAENLLLVYDHLKKAGDCEEGLFSIIENISYFWREGYWLSVKEVLEESLDFFEDEETRGSIYLNLGTIVYKLSEWDKAIDYYEKSLEIFEKIGDTHGMAQTYNNLGLVYADKGEWDKAIDYYEKDLEISEKIGDTHGIAITEYGIAYIYYQRKEFDTALKLYFESERTLKKIGDKINLMNVYYNLFLCYRDMNQKDEAQKYYQKYEELKQQLEKKNP